MRSTDVTHLWPSPAPGRRTVLLVDDDDLQRKLDRIRLRDAGYEVATASGGAQALRMLETHTPDAIVSDVLMGDLDGFGLCRRLRELPALRSVPIILLSAHYRDEPDQQLATRVGASALVARTPDFDAELAALHASLTRRPPQLAEADAALFEQHLRTNAIQLTRMLGKARDAEERWRTLMSRANDVIAVLSPEGIVLEVNQRWGEIFGVEPETLIGRHVSDFAAPEDREANVRLFAESLTTGGARVQAPLQHPDGKTIYMEFSCTVVELEGRAVVLTIGHDVTARVLDARAIATAATERRRLEESLLQAQKMEAIGRLTGGIAHDFNNMLAAILAYARFLLHDLAPADPRRADAAEIENAAERAAELTRQLLAFSRRQVLAPTVVTLDGVVAGLEKMLRRTLGEDIEIEVAAAPDAGTIRVDVGQLEQVIMNLAVNARDAMAGGGTLRLATANADVDDAPGVVAGRYVVLTVTDTGCGMSAETRGRIFEPFFTTKEQGRGTGLGLSTSYGIVKQSGGHIAVQSEVGHGTTMQIYLPRVDGAPEAARPKLRRLPDPGGTETILVIEDDDRVRAAVGRILRPSGYQLLVARDGADALAVLAAHAGSIDLVLSDVVMPGLSGPEVVVQIRERFPAVRALFMSGYSDHPKLHGGAARSEIDFIQKPFTTHDLLARLREILDA